MLALISLGAAATSAGATSDLSLTVQAPSSRTYVGDQLTYVVSVSNAGRDPSPATVDGSIGESADLVSVTPTQGRCEPPPALACEQGELGAGGTASIKVVLRPVNAGPLTVSARVNGADDANDQNNTARAVAIVGLRLGACANPRFGTTGPDVFRGTVGGDRLLGGQGNDNLSGGDGRDCIFGEGGDDVLKGGSGNDQLEGGSGDDLLTDGTGSDLVSGGFGNDTIEINGAPRTRGMEDLVSCGPGSDSLRFVGRAAAATSLVASDCEGIRTYDSTRCVNSAGTASQSCPLNGRKPCKRKRRKYCPVAGVAGRVSATWGTRQSRKPRQAPRSIVVEIAAVE